MRFFVVLVLSLGLCIPAFSAQVHEALSYYSSADTANCKPPAQAFYNNINAVVKSGPTVGSKSYFDSSNDLYWDGTDLGYVCAHGNQWLFALSDGTVYLDYLSDGWGETDMEWAVLYSCQVVCSPLEKPSNWWQPWIIESSDVFDCLHIVNGFRTNAYVIPAASVTTNYCSRLNNGGYVLQSWFDAVFWWGWWILGNDKASSMYFGTCEFDTFNSIAADPAATQTSDFWCTYVN